jgi:hypothetical protein
VALDLLSLLQRTEASLRKRLSRKARPRKAAVALLLAAPVLSLLAYAGAARWILSGPRLRGWINGHPDSLTLDYDAATSVWPGRVAIRNLRIRGSDQNVEWIVELQDARVDYSVLALASRTFRCTRLRGGGLAFHIRSKIAPARLAAADVSVLPPIPGFADPPTRSEQEAPPRQPGNPWRVDVRDIQLADFHDIWVDAVRYRGAARLAGSFFLRPGLLARIGPARIDFDRGEVRLGDAPAALSLSGSVAAAFEPYEPFAVHGSEVWDRVSGEVSLELRFARLQAIQYLVRSSPNTRLGDGSGTATIRGTIEKGIARGAVRASVHDGGVQLKEVALTGDADVGVAIPTWNLSRGPLVVSGSHAALTRVQASGSETSRDWWGRFDIPSGEIDSTTSATVTARSRDARPLLALFGVDLPDWTRGLLALEDFSGGARVALGPSLARVSDLDARGGDFRIQGNYLRRRAARTGAFLIEAGKLSVGLDLQAGSPKLRLLGATKWYEEQQARDKSSRAQPGPRQPLAASARPAAAPGSGPERRSSLDSPREGVVIPAHGRR